MDIQITKELNDKLKILGEYEFEIAGWLLGEVKDKQIYLDDLIIPEQEAGKASVDINQEGILDTLKNHKDKMKRIIGHFHTHNSMGAFWSGQDEDNMKTLIRNKNYFVFVVISSKADEGKFYQARVIVNSPFEISQECDLIVEDKSLDVLREKIKTLVSNKVKQYKPDITQYKTFGIDVSDPLIFTEKTTTITDYVNADSENDLVLHLKFVTETELNNISKIVRSNPHYTMSLYKDSNYLYKVNIVCDSNNKYKKLKNELLELGVTVDEYKVKENIGGNQNGYKSTNRYFNEGFGY
jgi:proteasome lid subunit RPN8/RPN11